MVLLIFAFDMIRKKKKTKREYEHWSIHNEIGWGLRSSKTKTYDRQAPPCTKHRSGGGGAAAAAVELEV
jgi:hypothetical protein